MSRNRKEMAIGLLIVVVAFALAAATPLDLHSIGIMGLACYGCLAIGLSLGRENPLP